MATENTGETPGEQAKKGQQEKGAQEKGAQAKQAAGKAQPRERGIERAQGGGIARRESLFPSLLGSWGGSPFGIMRRMMEDMDRMFEDWGGVGGGLAEARPTALRGTWAPRVDVFERNGKLVVRADLPGVSKDDLKVEVNEDSLVLQGERREEHEEEHEGVYRSERSYGSFYRAIPLPEGVDPEKAEARFDKGVLEISMDLPKEEKARVKRIEIQEGKGTGTVH